MTPVRINQPKRPPPNRCSRCGALNVPLGPNGLCADCDSPPKE